MTAIELSSGTIEYTDTGGDGPVLVLLHGLMMDASLVASGRLSPGVFGLFMQQMRFRAVRRLPIAFGWLTKRGDAVVTRWMRPVLTQAGIRRDTVRVLRAAAVSARLLPEARLVEVADSYTLIPLDQPARLAALIRDFISAR
jgi:pimeloyl-ACP methyl ester carboxylesterase